MTRENPITGAVGRTGRRVAGGVWRALGRTPRDFADYVPATVATGVRSPR